MPSYGYASITVKESTLNKVKEHLLEQMVKTVNEIGTTAYLRSHPSVSKWVEQTIAMRLEEERSAASPTAISASSDKTLNGGGSA
ncbi:MAG: hypothetical protein ABSB29_03765 [Nitrososphaerales archaeon]